ncbi:MAG TPA: DUF721 domain-containing protein [Bacteriovoracaceae bacterium]|nr:DUF721 domain-containing protein [Bacteriovoracaceae bacterium]
MFKKIDFKGLNYKELDRFDRHDLKRETLLAFYQTFDFLDLIKSWPEIVGATMSLVTSPMKLKNDSLYIITKHSVYSQELSFLSEEIKKEVFKVFPKLRPVLKKLVFQTQENFFTTKEATAAKIKESTAALKLHPQSPQYKKLKLEADRLFNDIPDPELREIMTSIFIQSRST